MTRSHCAAGDGRRPLASPELARPPADAAADLASAVGLRSPAGGRPCCSSRGRGAAACTGRTAPARSICGGWRSGTGRDRPVRRRPSGAWPRTARGRPGRGGHSVRRRPAVRRDARYARESAAAMPSPADGRGQMVLAQWAPPDARGEYGSGLGAGDAPGRRPRTCSTPWLRIDARPAARCAVRPRRGRRRQDRCR